jgi:hypothetical protein
MNIPVDKACVVCFISLTFSFFTVMETSCKYRTGEMILASFEQEGSLSCNTAAVTRGLRTGKGLYTYCDAVTRKREGSLSCQTHFNTGPLSR